MKPGIAAAALRFGSTLVQELHWKPGKPLAEGALLNSVWRSQDVHTGAIAKAKLLGATKE